MHPRRQTCLHASGDPSACARRWMRVASAAVCSYSRCEVAVCNARDSPAQAADVLRHVSAAIPGRTDRRSHQPLQLVAPPLHIPVDDGVCGRSQEQRHVQHKPGYHLSDARRIRLLATPQKRRKQLCKRARMAGRAFLPALQTHAGWRLSRLTLQRASQARPQRGPGRRTKLALASGPQC